MRSLSASRSKGTSVLRLRLKSPPIGRDEVRWIFTSATWVPFDYEPSRLSVDSVSFYTVRFSYGIIALLLPGVGHCWSSLAGRGKGNSGKWGRCPPVRCTVSWPVRRTKIRITSSYVHVCSITSWFAARYVLFTALTRRELIVADTPRRAARLRVVNICRREQRNMALIAALGFACILFTDRKRKTGARFNV